jgi:hypothetical protein
MAVKMKKLDEVISLTAEAVKVVSYADYYTQKPLFTALQVKNASAEVLGGFTLSIYNENGLIVNTQKTIEEIPFESAIEIELGNIISPLYFVELEAVKEESIFVELRKDKQVISKEQFSMLALPFDYWEGAQGNAE